LIFINDFGLNSIIFMAAFYWARTSDKQANKEVTKFRASWRTGLWWWRCW